MNRRSRRLEKAERTRKKKEIVNTEHIPKEKKGHRKDLENGRDCGKEITKEGIEKLKIIK